METCQNGILSEENYENLLNLSGTGVMGSIEIPKINVDIPIYHGTSEEVLASGVGHFQDSSLPVGGNNTRCILTGHRGLPNSKLFTRLDELGKEDLLFYDPISVSCLCSYYPHQFCCKCIWMDLHVVFTNNSYIIFYTN